MNKRLCNILAIIAILLTVIIAVEATPPLVTITSPVNGNYSLSNNIIFNISINGTGAQIGQTLFYVNSTLVANYTNNTLSATNTANCTNVTGTTGFLTCYFNISEIDGLYNFTVNAYDTNDSSGNISTASIIFGVDTVAPRLNITAPTNNSVVNNFVVQLYVNDTNINFTLVNVTNANNGVIVNSTILTGNGAFNITPTIPEGVYNITITAYDLANRSNTSNIYNITYDLPPTGNLTSLAQNGVIYIPGTTKYYSVNGTAADTYPGVKNVTILLNGVFNGTATFNSTNGNWNYTLYNLTAGQTQYNITAKIYDNNSNLLMVNGSFVVDNVTSTFSGVSRTPSDNGGTGSATNLSFIPSDNSGTISACWYNLNFSSTNVSVSCSNGTATLQQLYFSSGTYNITIYANDGFNNIGSTIMTFTVSDVAAPSIKINSPVSGATYGSGSTTSIDINVTTDENATCKWDIDTTTGNYSIGLNQLFTDSITLHTATYSFGAGESRTIYVSCIDMSGNIATTNVPFSTAAASSSSSSSSSGGGGSSSSGSGSGSTTTPDPSQAITYDLIPVGSKVIGIDSSSIPVSEIFITTLASSTNVKFVVTAVSSPSTTYTPATVYKYIQVDHPALSNDIISDAKIKFSVAKSWLTSNNKNKNDITLLRYTAQWDALTTTITNEDSNYVYYLADSPGLSLFAISTASPSANSTALSNTTMNTNATVIYNGTTNNGTNNSSGSTGNASSAMNWTLPIILLVVILAALVLFIIRKKKDSQTPPPMNPAN